MKVYTLTESMDEPKLRGKRNLIRYPAFIEPKIDGELNVYFGKHNSLMNKYSKARTDCPITKHLKRMDVDVIGELYFPPGKNGDLYNLLKNKTSHQLQYVIFDILRVGKKDLRKETCRTRREILLDAVRPSDQVSIIPASIAREKADVQKFLDLFKEHGFEGGVLKSMDSRYMVGNSSWVKIKFTETKDCKIVFIDPDLERMEVDVGPRRVGVKLVKKYKPLVEVGNVVEIEHHGVLKGGSLRHPIFRGKVVK
jgi:hypothetical protein